MKWARSSVLPRSVIGVLGVVAMCSALTACGEARVRAEDDLCVQYAALTEQLDALDSIDPDTATADELQAQTERVQDQLDAFQAVADDQLDTSIATLRAAVDDLALAVPGADAGADSMKAARPLIDDSLDDVDEASATLEQVADVKCGQ